MTTETTAPLTIDEARAIAADIEIPHTSDAKRPCAAVTTDGPDHHFRVYFGLEQFRKRSPLVGPAFTRPADACMLARALNEPLERNVVSRPDPQLNPDGSISDVSLRGSDALEELADPAA